MDDIKEKIKQALRHIWTNKYRLFLCLLTLCCLFGLVHYFKSADSATASISFNYSEASLGLNPNKTRFNAYEIVSDEVMERAIRRVGLQDSLTASQLAECLYLSPEGTGSANGSEYISTNYYLSINTRKLNLGNRKPTDLLQSVCESYREIFLSNYCDNQSILKEKLEVTTACEPYLRLNELEVRAAALNRYLNARLGENKSFTDDTNPDPSTNNFTTLGKMINNLVDYDLPNAMAFVIEGGVARDPAMLTSILEYKNKIDDIDMRTQQAYYDADKKGISIYEKSMTSIMMIPTVDEASEYYMSRTKTAMDALARAADASLADATDYQSEIVSTNYVIQKIRELDAGQPRLAVALVYLFREKAIELFTISICIANTAIMLLSISGYGFAASIQSLVTCLITFGDADGYALQLEIHDLTFVFGQMILYYAVFAPRTTRQEKRKRWLYLLLCCWFFLVGMKRIAIPAVVLFVLIALLLRKRKVPGWFYPAVGVCCILFFLAFLYCVRYGVISRLLNSFGIDMMGRDYLWSMANPYYEFSITYIGRGFEYVDTIIAQWYNDGLINQPYPFHNDILKVFVEVGFPGFLLWSSIQYVLTPLFWQRYADQETTLLYLSELGYMTVTYLTDNTAFYFWSTMALRLVTLAYAMERKKPPEPKVWMPDSRQEMRDRIHILMKEV